MAERKRPPTPEQLAAYFAKALDETAGEGSDDTGVLFFGDSDISNWDVGSSFPGLRLQRCGVGGAQMSHIAAFTPTAMERYRGLTAVVVVAGENDLPSLTAAETFVFFQAFLAAVREGKGSELPVFYISTKPEPRTEKIHGKYAEYDELIRAVADPNLVVVGGWEDFRHAGTDETNPALFADDSAHASAWLSFASLAD